MAVTDSQDDTGSFVRRRFPIGAELTGDGRVSVRVWAPDHARVAVCLDGTITTLAAEADGYYSGIMPGRAGSRYGFLLGDDAKPYPDPASRFQPDGPHGLSEVIDPDAHAWTDAAWRGVDPDDVVLYELHVGTFTAEGTLAAATAHLPALRDLGITVLQVMPVAEFPGRFGWGYDGVCLFAPTRLYGRPDDLRAFVDRAHALGLSVLLDVVYNHVGPDGNYLRAFSTHYFSDAYGNEWGEAINFDGPSSGPVREWVLTNVAYWLREFHVDGFRLDATQQIFDRSPEHLVAAIARTARDTAAPRAVLVTAENEPQHAHLVEPRAQGGFGLDAIYNEDFHHSARVALVGTREAYLTDYRGVASEWLACARHGTLFQGQHYAWQQRARGTPALHLPADATITFLENHDQVANAGRGERLVDLARPADLRAMMALLLLMPARPLLFQGQEFGAGGRFVYFADHEAPLNEAVARGRRDFLAQFWRLRDRELFDGQPLPHDEASWRQSWLDRHADDPRQDAWRALVGDLLRLRRQRPRRAGRHRLDGAAPDETLLVLRYFGDNAHDWLLFLNMGTDRDVASLSEPLIAPPAAARWQRLLSTEAPRYGGHGVMPWTVGRWPLAGHSLLLLEAVERHSHPGGTDG